MSSRTQDDQQSLITLQCIVAQLHQKVMALEQKQSAQISWAPDLPKLSKGTAVNAYVKDCSNYPYYFCQLESSTFAMVHLPWGSAWGDAEMCSDIKVGDRLECTVSCPDFHGLVWLELTENMKRL